MKKSLLIAATAFMLLVSMGCKKFLDQEVPGAFPEQDFYKTDADATQAVNGVYDMMQAHYNTAWGSMFMVKLLLSDESNAGGNDATDQPQYQTLDNYTFDATNSGVRDAWRMCYFTIYRANKVINRVDSSSALRKRLIAEARTLRAYNYMELVSLFGDVPLVLDDIAPGSYTTTGRAAKTAVYDQIEKDLMAAMTVLPPKSAMTGANSFRVSQGTAQALLGKAFLFQGDWANAATHLETVILSNQFKLEPSIGKAFSRAGEFGTESLFEISFTTDRSYDWGNFPWGAQPESNIHVQLMGPRGDFYTKAPADSLIAGWGFNLPTQKMWDAFVNAGDVNRRKQSMMSAVELIAAGGNWTNPTAYDYSGYFQRKYGSFQAQTGGPIGELNYGTNWRHLRYADVLLMAAEAFHKAGNDSKARGYLNQVRQRSGLGDVTASGPALFTAIVLERQLELAFEGFRYVDLVRWGLAPTELGTLGFVAGKHELLPIPDYETKTGLLSQNPIY